MLVNLVSQWPTRFQQFFYMSCHNNQRKKWIFNIQTREQLHRECFLFIQFTSFKKKNSEKIKVLTVMTSMFVCLNVFHFTHSPFVVIRCPSAFVLSHRWPTTVTWLSSFITEIFYVLLATKVLFFFFSSFHLLQPLFVWDVNWKERKGRQRRQMWH